MNEREWQPHPLRFAKKHRGPRNAPTAHLSLRDAQPVFDQEPTKDEVVADLYSMLEKRIKHLNGNPRDVEARAALISTARELAQMNRLTDDSFLELGIALSIHTDGLAELLVPPRPGTPE